MSLVNVQQNLVLINTSTNYKIVNLPTAANSLSNLYFIKDAEGSASTFFIYVSTSGSDLIDNRFQMVPITNNFGSLMLSAVRPGLWTILGSYDGNKVQTRIYSPYNARGMFVWLSAMNPYSPVLTPGSTSNLVGWNDLSPKGNNVIFTQGTPFYSPQDPAINFSTASTCMIGKLRDSGINTRFTASTVMSVVIANPNTDSVNRACVFGVGNNALDPTNSLLRSVLCSLSTTGSNWRVGTQRSTFLNGMNIPREEFVFTTYFSGTRCFSIVNTANNTLFASSCAFTGSFDFQFFGLAQNPGFTSLDLQMNGTIREVILYGSNTYDNYQIWKIENAMANKYGLSTSLTSADLFITLYHDPSIPFTWTRPPGATGISSIFISNADFLNQSYTSFLSANTFMMAVIPASPPFFYFQNFGGNPGDRRFISVSENFRPDLDNLRNYTIEMYISGNGSPAASTFIGFSKSSAPGGHLALRVSSSSTRLNYFEVNSNGSTGTVANFNNSFLTGSLWRHLVITATSTTLQMYVDASTVGTSGTRPGGVLRPFFDYGGAGGAGCTVQDFRIGFFRFYEGIALAQSNITYAYNRARIGFNA